MYDKMITEAVSKFMDDKNAPEIKSAHKRQITESVLKETVKYQKGLSESSEPTTQTAGVSNWDPVVIKMLRRSMPKLLAFDLVGVQAMTAPTGLIFAMRAKYTNQNGTEALFNEANSAFSGAGAQTGDTSGFPADHFAVGDPSVGTDKGTGMSKTAGEVLGSTGNPEWNSMSLSIERVSVETQTRKLKAEFTRELESDMKNVHGLDAQTELANILSAEIITEKDREILRTVNVAAVIGAEFTTLPGRYDLNNDSDGRWSVEKYKGLIMQIEFESNQVSIDTRRGKANRVICSANVASALSLAGYLEHNPSLQNGLIVDPSANAYAGMLLGKYHVYIDPFASVDYVTVGYKGDNAYDAGIFYAPYMPLTMYKAVGEDNFQPKIGFTSRYGIVANPFEQKLATGVTKAGLGLGQGENKYYRKFQVTSIRG